MNQSLALVGQPTEISRICKIIIGQSISTTSYLLRLKFWFIKNIIINILIFGFSWGVVLWDLGYELETM